VRGLLIVRRGQIWEVNLDPTLGGEIQKKRPCVVISSDEISKTDVKLVVPLTERKTGYVDSMFHVGVDVTDAEAWEARGLKKYGFADVLQTRCVSVEKRFVEHVATMKANKVEEIVFRLGAVIEINV
jgi:mRNA interferase MazF